MTDAASEGWGPYFSVVIPTYRRPELLAQALESVAAQTFLDLEIIVVDDDPSSSGRSVVAAFGERRPDLRVSYRSNDRAAGGSGARNAGVHRARGAWVAFLDDDDTWMPAKLAAVHQLIERESRPELVLVYSANVKFDFDTGVALSTSRPQARGRVLQRVLYENCVGGMSVVVARRDVLLEIGGLDERFASLQDMELYVRLAERGTFDFLHEPLVRVRASRRERITVDPRKKLQGATLFAEKYDGLLRRSARLRHRSASRQFVFALAANDVLTALRHVPWTAAGLVVDPTNLIYVFSSLGRQVKARRVRADRTLPASPR